MGVEDVQLRANARIEKFLNRKLHESARSRVPHADTAADAAIVRVQNVPDDVDLSMVKQHFRNTGCTSILRRLGENTVQLAFPSRELAQRCLRLPPQLAIDNTGSYVNVCM